MVLRMQLETPKKRDRYEHVPPKISSGSKKKPVAVSKVVARDAQLQYGHSLLTDARKDNLYLEGLVLEMRGQINCLQAKLDEDRADCATREKALVQENKNLQEKFLSVVEEQEKGAIVEDVDKIRLIRELRDKSSTVVALQTQIEGLERQLTTAHLQNVKLLEEMERVNGRAKDELTTRMVSEGLHNNSQVSTKAFAELREMVSDLRQEKDLLKLANERLLQSSLDDSRVTSIQRELHTWQVASSDSVTKCVLCVIEGCCVFCRRE
jgi:protein fantom